VRAFLHFDLLRLFAPNIERGDEQAIPYVEHFSISPVERSTVREVYERIVADLTEAYGLLRDAQPASGRTPEELYVSQYAAAATHHAPPPRVRQRPAARRRRHRETEKYADQL